MYSWPACNVIPVHINWVCCEQSALCAVRVITLRSGGGGGGKVLVTSCDLRVSGFATLRSTVVSRWPAAASGGRRCPLKLWQVIAVRHVSRPLADLRVQRRRADPRQSGGSWRRHRPDVHQTAHDTHAMSSPPGHAHTSEWITVALLAHVGLSRLCACVCIGEAARADVG